MQQKPSVDFGGGGMEAVAPISVTRDLVGSGCKTEPMDLAASHHQLNQGSTTDLTGLSSVESHHEPDSNYAQMAPTSPGVQSEHGSEKSTAAGTGTTAGHSTRVDRIRDGLENAIEEDAKSRIEDILDSVRQLSDVEKLLLYLKLPTGTRSKDLPPQTPSSSLHLSNLEHAQAFTWIQSHLEEDNETCLRKDEVYDDYKMYCETNCMKPLNTADFGKVMKRAFPNVKPRRLGQRGQSKYCYSGLRKKVELQPPSLPDLGETCEPIADPQKSGEDELMPECIALVCEWAENLLGRGFNNVRELAEHLLSNLYVNSKSTAAFALTAAMQKPATSNGSKMPVSSLFASQSSGRGAQVQLQRRIKERELLRETKSKIAQQREESTIKQEPQQIPTTAAAPAAAVTGNNRRRSIKTKLFSPPVGTCNAVQPTQSSAISSTAPSAQQGHGRPMPFIPPPHMGGGMPHVPMHVEGAAFDPMAWRQPQLQFPMTPGHGMPGTPGTPFGTPGTPFGNPLLDPPTPFKNMPPGGDPGLPYPMHPRGNLDPSPRSAFIPVTTNSPVTPGPIGGAPKQLSKPEHPRLESILKGELQSHMYPPPPEYLQQQMAPPQIQHIPGRGGAGGQQQHHESVLQTPTKPSDGGLMVPQLHIPQIQPSPTKRKFTPIKPKCPTGKTVSSMLKEARGFGPESVDQINNPFLNDMRPVSAILKESRDAQRGHMTGGPMTPTQIQQKFTFENFNANMKRPRGRSGGEPQSASKRQIQESQDQPGTPKCVDVFIPPAPAGLNTSVTTSTSRLSIDDLSISSLENDSLLEFLNSGANPLDSSDGGGMNRSRSGGGQFIHPSGLPQTPHYTQLELLDPPTPFKNTAHLRASAAQSAQQQSQLPMSPLVAGSNASAGFVPTSSVQSFHPPPPEGSVDMYMSHPSPQQQQQQSSPQRRRPSFGEYYEHAAQFQGRPPQHAKKKDSKKLMAAAAAAAGGNQSKTFLNYPQSTATVPSPQSLSPEPSPRPPSHHQVSPQDAGTSVKSSSAVTMTSSASSLGNRYAAEQAWGAMSRASERGLAPPPPSYNSQHRRMSGGAPTGHPQHYRPQQINDMMCPQSPNIYPSSDQQQQQQSLCQQPNYWSNLPPSYRHITPVTNQPASNTPGRPGPRTQKLSPGRAVKVNTQPPPGGANQQQPPPGGASSGLNVSDELQSTLDVLRDFDTQYFNQSGDVDSGDDPSLRQQRALSPADLIRNEFAGIFGSSIGGGQVAQPSSARRSTSDQNQVVPPEGALTPDTDVFIVENLTSNKYSRTVTTR